MTRPDPRLLGLGLLLLTLAACAVRPPPGDGPPGGSAIPRELPPDPVPRPEPRSAYGNGPVYEVYGRPYRVLDTSYGYSERGVASWYGRKFHGRLTSSREPYDMHAMTAAHKTLPLPTWVQVRNLRNDRSVIVRVNDRGPFVDNRIIDLSYAAARRLDMVRDGTSLVEVTAISFDEAPSADPETAGPATAGTSAGDTAGPAGRASDNKVWLQVGAFGERANAERRYRLLAGGGIDNAFVHEETGPQQPLYRVRIGPIDDVEQFDRLVARLGELGISDSHLVAD